MIYIVLFIISIVLIYIFFVINHNNLILVKSTIDDRSYLVNNLPDAQAAADTLAKLRQNMITLVSAIDKDFQADYVPDFKERVINIKFMENPILVPSKEMTSYTVNKTDRLVMCLRGGENFELQDFNTVTYVCIHEIGHVGNKFFNHGNEWLTLFTELLKLAMKIGVYKDQDYLEEPKLYCGVLLINERLY